MMGYKLTDVNAQTGRLYGEPITWAVGETVTTDGHAGLCTKGCLHYYESPVLALMMNPSHANITDPRMFEVEVSGHIVTDGLKCGCTSIKVVREVEIPVVTAINRGAFGVLCAKVVYHDESFNKWTDAWLTGVDRSAAAAAAGSAWAAAAWAAAAIDFVAIAARAMQVK